MSNAVDYTTWTSYYSYLLSYDEIKKDVYIIINSVLDHVQLTKTLFDHSLGCPIINRKLHNHQCHPILPI